MAKIEGTQSIPSELKELYDGTLTPLQPDTVVRKRYPWRVPLMQEGGYKVSGAQQTQRARWKTIRNKFKTVDYATRQRWYAARPVWHSFLWYYNYFMMSGLTGNVEVGDQGGGVIKSIQHLKHSIPTTGGHSFAITTVDPTKCVVMIQGASYISDTVHHYDGISADDTEITVTLSPEIDPEIAEIILSGAGGEMNLDAGTGSGYWGNWFVTDVAAAAIKIKLQNLFSALTFGWSLDIIEHKSQTIYPVITSIAANAVVIDWANIPSVAADVSIDVIEYI